MNESDLIRVYAYAEDYDSGFADRVYTREAFDAFLVDLEQFIAAGRVKLPKSRYGPAKVEVDRAKSCIHFVEGGGDEIVLRWESLEIVRSHEPIAEVSFSVSGFEDTYLHIEEE